MMNIHERADRNQKIGLEDTARFWQPLKFITQMAYPRQSATNGPGVPAGVVPVISSNQVTAWSSNPFNW
jgi:hypothetical protein